MVISPAKSLRRALVWFRRDLRVADHPALAHALRDAEQVWCVFVLDKAILDGLPPGATAEPAIRWWTLLRRWAPELRLLGGRAIHAPWKAKAAELEAAKVALGRDYPHTIVDHDVARQKTLARFGARGSGSPVVAPA